ncbi:uncharacterized protein MONOS_6908 [Monocercomonoides exilis]|uniref:uncharacterized protein n=1 Tax=Monocercomonoides exilis TaxID=2049356 RepID=UPI00355A626F|nr:hypothetical protein MONOS_6908 [Monocercomonoides exilis]|eukprot:MONOS_6908.1-p1 / transcript=MONOS_6908.1 / gene=MONOS_6908 / organism=Monocercomonoides_exilis_PA203 / gene_product=unspecified product / transcript_product=unspecified product / location=Mono_scaffold00226:56431-56960(-) / protein_length=135 / sequence_SO=supercontig / SO=protein_coding / is_pseudo=false
MSQPSSSSISSDSAQPDEISPESVREILANEQLSVPHYTDLAWRLEAPVASRTHPLSTEISPHFLLRLDTTTSMAPVTVERKGEQPLQYQPKENHSEILVCDVPNMQHLTNELDRALRELQSVHSRRMMRIFGAT